MHNNTLKITDYAWFFSINKEGKLMFGLGTGELVIIAVVVILLFGAKRIPQMGGSLGEALKNFKKEVTKKDDED